jgi:glutathione S-transferase
MPLFSEGKITEMRTRWNNIQAEFVDEPRRSVEQADQLVAAAMQQLAEGFAAERASLEQQWESGDNVSTEDLRVALQRYRAFFGRLLNVA